MMTITPRPQGNESFTDTRTYLILFHIQFGLHELSKEGKLEQSGFSIENPEVINELGILTNEFKELISNKKGNLKT
ncbi:MAG: hypothetical protein GYB55_15280 [Cytophagales bacterium]|mgnify:CR=1 FL=1|uniref:hypothetical protein n=1 Tax=Cyclobacterium marinum TaxID=104 RepID=UPI0030D91820|nr:hypothetical protein [Cytophagales bacterium]|tara:strand:+ start:10346 stop:10573 length:228 start_codon:yes stop_codon:yes gene_type:complete